MLERETDTILSTLRTQTIGGRDSILLRNVLVCEIPRGIKAYLRADVHSGLAGDLFGNTRFQRVDQATPGLTTLSRAFITSMTDGYSFPRDEFFVALENAVHFLENYLCRPQWTLASFVFEAKERIGVGELQAKLDYTVDYAYFRTLIERVMKQRSWREIGAEDFRALIASLDEQVVRQHNPRELALLAKPIFDFLLLKDTPPDAPVSLKPILLFFEDKKMTILRDYIESICRIRERGDITLDELTALIEDLSLERPVPPVAPAPESLPEVPVEEPLVEEPKAASVTPEPPIVEIQEEIMLDVQPPAARPPDESPSFFESVTEDPDGRDDAPSYTDLIEKDASPPPPAVPDRPSDGASGGVTDNVSLSLTFAGMQDSQKLNDGSHLPDLNDIIPSHLRHRFIKRIFDRDELQYRDVIDALNGTETWRDASLLLNKLYRLNNIDPFDADIVEFTDAIHRRYRETDKDES